MASYDWFELQGRPWFDRFPAWVLGRDVWRERFTQPSVESGAVIADLAGLRQQNRWGRPPLLCPRVFISHRKDDRAEALAMAKIAAEEGFQFWLDILDPTLQMVTPPTSVPVANWLSLVIAAVIEMALLNSTHVVAIMTVNTHGGMWIPYEYGRVKEPAVHSPQAAAWLHPTFAKAFPEGNRTLPEYMLLGEVTRRTAEVRRWLADELGRWKTHFPTCPNGAGDPAPAVASDLPEPKTRIRAGRIMLKRFGSYP